MNEISNPHFSVEDLATHITTNVTRLLENRVSDVTAFHTDAPDKDAISSEGALNKFIVREAPPLKLQPPFEVKDDAGYHVDELLQYHDKDFLRNAYQALLKRFPDAEGFNSYLHRLRSGRINKIDVLASMRYSAEGMARAVQVKSLRFPALVRHAGRVPVIGYFVRLAIAILNLPRNAEMQRQAEAHAVAQVERVAEHLNEVARHTAAELQRLGDHLANLIEAQHHLLLDNRRTAAEQSTRITSVEDRAAAAEVFFSENQEHLALHEQWFERFDTRADETRRYSDERHEELRRELQLLSRGLQHARSELTLQHQRLAQAPRGGDAPHASLDAATSNASALDAGDSHTLADDAFYSAFVEHFRGSVEDITSRLRVHLPLLRDVPEGDVVDLGAGRGEWLELLKEAGREAYGVDTNRILVEGCAARGLRVVVADAVAHLRELPPASLAAVCGFHIVEHLPTDALMSLITETMRVLRPGGMLLLETPNPENVLVGSHLFYADPTHHHPLPSSTLSFLLEICGFDDITVRNLHPRDADKLNGEDELTRRFNDLFYGAMDYSISGRKPTS